MVDTKQDEKVFLGITVTKEVKEKLMNIAKEERRSVSSQASLMLEEALKERKDDEQP